MLAYSRPTACRAIKYKYNIYCIHLHAACRKDQYISITMSRLYCLYYSRRCDDVTRNRNGVLDGTSLAIEFFLSQRIFTYNTDFLYYHYGT